MCPCVIGNGGALFGSRSRGSGAQIRQARGRQFVQLYSGNTELDPAPGAGQGHKEHAVLGLSKVLAVS